MLSFSYTCSTQTRFGAGEHRRIVDVLPEAARRILLVRGRSGLASKSVLACLQAAGLDVTELACEGEPTVPSLDAALDKLGGFQADAVIACGGGAALDMGKALCFALSHGLTCYADFAGLKPALMDALCPMPCIAVPTTAGTGAEVTANAVIGVPDKNAKISLRGRGLIPRLAIVDPDLMCGAPMPVVLHSGLDAVTQVFESFTSNAATPFSDALTRSVKEKGLPALKQIIDARDVAAWPDLAWVSHVSGLALANSGLGAAHGLASVIGGRYDAPHGALCGRFLAPVLRQNLLRAPSGSDVHARIASCVTDIQNAFAPTQTDDPMSGFETWIDAKGLPHLSDWGVKTGDLSALATQGMAASSSQKNAVTLSHQDYLQVLRTAF